LDKTILIRRIGCKIRSFFNIIFEYSIISASELILLVNLRSNSQNDIQSNYSKLASGSRINKAADDAAGLAISEQFKAQIRSARQANRNANDGISMVQVAEGGLNEISNIITRLRELGIQAASDTIGPVERQFLNVEYDQLLSEIDRIADGTEFNGTTLLNGTGVLLDFQVGTRISA
jgi:flagellin